MGIDDFVKLFSATSGLVISLAVLFFGYLQWRGGKRFTEMSETARNLIGASSDVLTMKESEIGSLRAENDRLRAAFQFLIATEDDAGRLQRAWQLLRGEAPSSP